MCLCNEQVNKISFLVGAVHKEINEVLFSGNHLKKIVITKSKHRSWHVCMWLWGHCRLKLHLSYY